MYLLQGENEPKTATKLIFLFFVIEKELHEDSEDDEEEEETGVQAEPGCDVIESGDVGVLFLEQLKLTANPDERTDFLNFRILLWRCMTEFPERVEPRCRELCPLLLRFIRSALLDILIA